MNEAKRGILKNRVRVLTIPFKNTQTVTALLFVGTGSHYEEKNLSGISHYLEHLFFKGSKKYTNPLKISTLLDSLGADYNAFTDHETTAFYVKVVKDKVETALDVMSDFLKHPIFSPTSIEREKGVILEELRMYYDTPQRRVLEIFDEVLYGDQPAGRDIGGTPQSVKGINRKDVLDYFEKQYRGENVVVVFAGNITHATSMRFAEKYFSALPEGQGFDKRPVTQIAMRTPLVKVDRRPTDQTHIAVGFEGVNLRDERRFPLAVLATVLGGGMSSRLFTEVREKRGLAYRINAYAHSGTDFGQVAVTGGITNGKVDEALSVIVEQFRHLKKERVKRAELERAKNSIEGHLFLGLESSDAVANFWGQQEILLNESKKPQDFMKEIASVKAADVQNVANEVFLRRAIRLALIGPYKNEKKLTTILGRV
jgi:predicted Zn-dependent peptidase